MFVRSFQIAQVETKEQDLCRSAYHDDQANHDVLVTGRFGDATSDYVVELSQAQIREVQLRPYQ